ncbi:DUF4126 family protein [Spirosoma sp. RP8]|uniref:DUF4126 family protein n=1 Tax=Spirosoma liriopis TaxID=2937440 RepID=A0ABT0HK41_9BACT|nr:DUF4126 family protein [Spirosoma liriopis]MCK8492523.1 DUF4126 family protein [Spirosoma liriopis]
MIRSYLNAFQIGIVAGMRALSAPAMVSHKLAQMQPDPLPDSKLHSLASPKTATVLKVMAVGELIGDKLPNTPNRTEPSSVVGRMASGALSGAALSEVDGKDARYGAVMGAAGALVGTFAFFHLRRWLTHEQGLPDPVVALAEDVIAVGTAWRLIHQSKPADVAA